MHPRSPVVFCGLMLLALPLVAQQAKAVLHAPLAVLPVESAPFQRLGDLDGDGDLDAVGTRLHGNGSNSQVYVWENVGGAFAQVFVASGYLGGQVGGGQRSHAVATGDLNTDGREDFVVIGSGVARRYLSAPGWQFTVDNLILSMPHAGSRAVAIGDFDGDGTADVVVAADRYDSSTGALDVFFGNGSLLSMVLPVSWRAGLSLQSIDFDGDSVLDLLYADKGASTAYVYSLVGGQLATLQTLTTTLNYNGGTPWLWMAGDLDGDLDVDVVCFKPELGTNGVPRYQLFRRTSPSALVAEALAIGGPAEYLADIDGDGDLDGVCCGGGGGPTYYWPKLDFSSKFELSQNRGGGDFARAWGFPNAGSESMAAAADVDGDGDVDLVAGRSVFYGDGPWSAQPMPIAGGSETTRFLRANDLFDNNGDGDIDIDLSNDNDGSGACTVVYRPLAPPPGYQLSLPFSIDVDGDGVRDRVSRLYQNGAVPTFVGMAWERNNGSGHFSYGGPCGAAGMLIGPASQWSLNKLRRADLDGDGDEDVFVEGGVIHWNNSGVFSAPTPVLSNGLYLDAVADFDGDGLRDLVTSGYLGQLAQVWRGTGLPGTGFQLALVLGDLPHEPAATATGDLDGDGDLDLVRPNANGEPVLFVNVTAPGGAIAFDQHVLGGIALELSDTSGTATAPVRPTIAIADFDLDGDNDLALGRVADESNVGIVLRRVSWSNPPSLADYEVIRQVFVDGFAADADGDGVVDIMGTHSVRSRHYSRAAAGTRVQRYAGVPGEAGAVPVLGATGPFRVGVTEVLRLGNVPGPTVAVLGLSLGEDRVLNTPLLGLILYLDLATTILGTMSITESGEGIAAASATLPILLPNGLQGWTFYTQAFVLDGAAWNGVTQTNLLVKTVGW